MLGVLPGLPCLRLVLSGKGSFSPVCCICRVHWCFSRPLRIEGYGRVFTNIDSVAEFSCNFFSAPLRLQAHHTDTRSCLPASQCRPGAGGRRFELSEVSFAVQRLGVQVHPALLRGWSLLRCCRVAAHMAPGRRCRGAVPKIAPRSVSGRRLCCLALAVPPSPRVHRAAAQPQDKDGCGASPRARAKGRPSAA